MIRITGGALRGRTLKTLRGRDSRPTLSRVREAIFNILGDSLRRSSFLDLYSGVGTMGIEALSRGAREALFVERSARCARILGENLAALGLRERGRVIRGDVLQWVESSEVCAEVVFGDPPYAGPAAARTLELLGSVLGRGVRWVIIQHGPRQRLPDCEGSLVRVRSQKYGDTVVDFYEPRPAGSVGV